MLSVINIERTTEEPVIGYDPAKVAVEEELNESYALSFEIAQNENDDCFELLQMENFLHLDENGQEYRIKTVNRASRRNLVVKTITANHVFFDIIGVKQDKSTALNGSKTFEIAMNYALNGTGWQWSLLEGSSFNALEMENYQGNALDLFNKLQERHSFEWFPDSSTKTVYIAKRIGVDTDAQIRYKHNMTTIKDNSNTNGLVNKRKGYGKKKEFASGTEPTVLQDSDYLLVVTWADQASINKYGVRWGDDFENENYTQSASMLAAIAEDGKSKPFPEISLSMSYASLKEYGEDISLESTQLGNGVYVIHEPLDIDVQARILKRKYYPLSDVKMPELTIGSLRPSIVKQGSKARLAVAGTERRLINNEAAVRAASANVTKALAELATSQGDLNELSILIVQLQDAINDLETSVPPDVQYQLDTINGQLTALDLRLDDVEALLFAHEGLFSAIQTKITALETAHADQLITNESLQSQIDELKGV